MNRFQSFRAFLIYRRAVMMAEKAHKQNGNRYFVIPCVGSKVELIVTDRKNFRGLKRKHYISEDLHIEDVLARCFYFTASKLGSDGPTDEQLRNRQMTYQLWYEERRKQRKVERAHHRHLRAAYRKMEWRRALHLSNNK